MLVMWFVAVLVVILSARVYSKLQSLDYDEVAVPYLKSIIPQISQWDPEATRALMVAEVSAAIPDEQFNRGIAMFSRLGELQNMSDPEFEKVYRDQQTIIGKQTIVEYNTEAKYANGDATINVKLLDKDGHFEIYRINFSSEVLLQ
ncbi:MAG: hypothetical protein ACWGOL_00800 [Desulfuromonadales bacterium]